MAHKYYIYILTTRKKTVLYTGFTNDLENRLHEHVNSLRKGFTSRYNCHHLIYFEEFKYVNDAKAREKEIKGWKRSKKEDRINSKNPGWEFLSFKNGSD
jgi:putative endonuclease